MACTALVVAAPANAQAVDVGGSATGTGAFIFLDGPSTFTLAVTGTPEAAAGPVALTTPSSSLTFTGDARCIAIDATATGFSASISGVITGGASHAEGFRSFEVTVYDNTPSAQPDQFGHVEVSSFPPGDCAFDHPPAADVVGDYVIRPVGACPPGDDDDNDGLTDDRESLFSTLLRNSDSDLDGIADGNDDANGNGEDDEDEDDDEEDGCPDEDSDGDGEDDEDEDDDEDD